MWIAFGCGIFVGAMIGIAVMSLCIVSSNADDDYNKFKEDVLMKVVLYSTNCPRCLILEKKLKDKGIEFEIVTDLDLMLEKGFMNAPMLEVDGEAIDFAKAINWVNEQ